MTNYEKFKVVWLGSIVLFITLLILLGIGKVGSNDLKNLVGEEEYAQIVKENTWSWGH